jgi:TerB-C domain
VTALLSKVFEEQVPPEPVASLRPSEVVVSESERQTASLLGLDAEHSAFLRLLLTRPSWPRSELNDIAADMELMLDGALERINEAALDKHEMLIAEGQDPIEIAQELKEAVAA